MWLGVWTKSQSENFYEEVQSRNQVCVYFANILNFSLKALSEVWVAVFNLGSMIIIIDGCNGNHQDVGVWGYSLPFWAKFISRNLKCFSFWQFYISFFDNFIFLSLIILYLFLWQFYISQNTSAIRKFSLFDNFLFHKIYSSQGFGML